MGYTVRATKGEREHEDDMGGEEGYGAPKILVQKDIQVRSHEDF